MSNELVYLIVFCRFDTCFLGKWILETDFNDNSEDFVFLWHRSEKLKSY